MNRKTRDILSELESYLWFSNVGNRSEVGDVTFVDSWGAAVASCASRKWEDFQQDIHNYYIRKVGAHIHEGAERWNAVLSEVESRLAVHAFPVVEKMASNLELPQVFVDSVRWDVLGICMEVEFSDITPPFFFAAIVRECYRSGHFPCGWDGPDLPDGWCGNLSLGKLIVY